MKIMDRTIVTHKRRLLVSLQFDGEVLQVCSVCRDLADDKKVQCGICFDNYLPKELKKMMVRVLYATLGTGRPPRNKRLR
jgi:hypothetical protein